MVKQLAPSKLNAKRDEAESLATLDIQREILRIFSPKVGENRWVKIWVKEILPPFAFF